MKKNLIGIVLSFALLYAMTGCANASTGIKSASTKSTGQTSFQSDTESNTQENSVYPQDTGSSTDAPLPRTNLTAEEDNILIVYYSYSGKTKRVAERLAAITGGDLYEVEVANPYSADMYEVSDRAKEELESGNLPELNGTLPDITPYDIILVGGPVWSSTLPPALVNYLDQTDFVGKMIAPFWTYDGNEGNYSSDFSNLAESAVISKGIGLAYVDRYEEAELDRELNGWMEKLSGAKKDNLDMQINTPIIITVGDTTINAQLNNSAAAQEFKSILPTTITMTRMGGHEYWGSLVNPLTHADTSDLQTGYTVGDLAFWTPGDLFAVYFADPDEAPEGLMILGEITTDLSLFDNLGENIEMHIELAA